MAGEQQPYSDDNIFAKILRGEIPSAKVFEDDNALVIMDAMPSADGHCLVIPKTPSRNLLDADPRTLSQLMPLIQKVSQAVRKAFDADGIRLAQFNENAAGQTIYHLHFHIIPMKDGVSLKPHAGEMADFDKLKSDAEKLRSALEIHNN